MKNKDLIIVNLEESIEQLQETVNSLRNNEDFSNIELQIDLEHAYHHINYAWHIRDASISDVEDCSKDNFIKWSKFPLGEINEYE